jgi:hypothetical protein
MRNVAGARPAEQQRRERLRLQAAGRFACGDGVDEIARDLRVTPRIGAAATAGPADGGIARAANLHNAEPTETSASQPDRARSSTR